MRINQPDLPFFTAYNPPKDEGIDCGPDSMTHQECAQECDIGYIMRKYAATGILPNNGKIPLDGAIQEMIGSDFQDLQNRMIAVQEEFDALPAKVRDRFGSDPARLIAFLSDESNRDEAKKLGLLKADTPALVAGEGGPASAGKGVNVDLNAGVAG